MTVTSVFALGMLCGVIMATFAVLIGEYMGKRLAQKLFDECKKSEGITK